MTSTSTETPTSPGLIQTLEDQVLELADHEAWLDAQIRELEFANNQDCQDDNRKLAQLLSEETATMKETTASQESGSNRRMAQRIEEELKNINIKYNVISNVLQVIYLFKMT
ncbi:hypothetical protein BGZ80_010701, partial [Entomortierella chlamydospora]